MLDNMADRVSIQLVFPASGKASTIEQFRQEIEVSIQLVFPASGKERRHIEANVGGCFHSISFPSEWGLVRSSQEY